MNEWEKIGLVGNYTLPEKKLALAIFSSVPHDNLVLSVRVTGTGTGIGILSRWICLLCWSLNGYSFNIKGYPKVGR